MAGTATLAKKQTKSKKKGPEQNDAGAAFHDAAGFYLSADQ